MITQDCEDLSYPSGTVTRSVSDGDCSLSLGPRVILMSKHPNPGVNIQHKKEVNLGRFRLLRFGDYLLLQHYLAYPN